MTARGTTDYIIIDASSDDQSILTPKKLELSSSIGELTKVEAGQIEINGKTIYTNENNIKIDEFESNTIDSTNEIGRASCRERVCKLVSI